MIRVVSLIVFATVAWGLAAPVSAQPWEKKYADQLVFSSSGTTESKTITLISAALATGGWTYTLPDAGASASFALTTGAGATVFTGPTATRTYTLPDATTTILTTNALVTVGQGGIGIGTLASNGVLYGNGTGAVQALAVNSSATKNFLTQSSSAAPAWGTVAQADVSGLTTASSPSFAGLTVGSTSGLVSSNAGVLAFNTLAANSIPFASSTTALTANLPDLTYSASAGMLDRLSDAGTSTVNDLLTITHNSSGTPVANFGTGLLFNGKTSTTNDRTMGEIQSIWTTATEGSQVANMVFRVANNTALTTEMTLAPTGLNLASGNTYQINGTSVLSNNTLGSGVTASSLQSVGTLSGLTVNGTTAINNSGTAITGIGNVAGFGNITIGHSGAAAAAGGTISVTAGDAGSISSAAGTITEATGAGAAASGATAATAGGALTVTIGNGGAAAAGAGAAGAGGAISMSAGTGGAGNATNPVNGAAGGNASITAGNGGNGATTANAGAGGLASLVGGNAGTGGTSSNVNSGGATINAGNSTGSGTSTINFQASPALAAAGSANTSVTIASIDGSGNFTLGKTSTTTGTIKLANSANANVASITTASQAASNTYTIPDAGGAAKVMLTSGGGLERTSVITGSDPTTASTTQASTGLSFSIGASETWAFEIFLAVQNTTGLTTTGLNLQIAIPASGSPAVEANMEVSGHTTTLAAPGASPLSYQIQRLTGTANVTTSVILSAAAANSEGWIRIYGTVINGTTAGSVTLNWASNKSGSTITLHKGSYLVARKM